MEFVKKNMLLTVILSIAAIAAVALIVFLLGNRSEMERMKSARTKNILKIKALNKQKLAPVQENVDNLGADFNLLDLEIQLTYRQFGVPQRASFKAIAESLAFDLDSRLIPFKKNYKTVAAFVASVEKMTKEKQDAVLVKFSKTIEGAHSISEIIRGDIELNLINKFTIFWNKEKKLTISNALKLFIEKELVVVKNPKGNATALYSAAVKAYNESLPTVKVIKTVSGKEVENSVLIEPVDNVNASMLNTFGLPILMDNIPRKCKDYMQQFKTNILTSLGGVTVKPEAINFSFDEFLTEDQTASFPSPSQIPYIVEHWRAVSDIVSIIGQEMGPAEEDKQITSFNKIERIGEIEGIEEKSFVKYKYLIEFSAPMEVVRKSINAIEDSKAHGRVLIIRQLTFEKVEDGVADFEKTLATIQDKVKSGAKEYTSKGLKDPRLPESKEGYGWTIIGSDNVTAKLVIENVSYIGNELKAKK